MVEFRVGAGFPCPGSADCLPAVVVLRRRVFVGSGPDVALAARRQHVRAQRTAATRVEQHAHLRYNACKTVALRAIASVGFRLQCLHLTDGRNFNGILSK